MTQNSEFANQKLQLQTMNWTEFHWIQKSENEQNAAKLQEQGGKTQNCENKVREPGNETEIVP